MQMKIVNKLLQRISNVPRMFADVTSVLENLEAETRLGSRSKNPATYWSRECRTISILFPNIHSEVTVEAEFSSANNRALRR